jgi:hypothetical protein
MLCVGSRAFIILTAFVCLRNSKDPGLWKISCWVLIAYLIVIQFLCMVRVIWSLGTVKYGNDLHPLWNPIGEDKHIFLNEHSAACCCSVCLTYTISFNTERNSFKVSRLTLENEVERTRKLAKRRAGVPAHGPSPGIFVLLRFVLGQELTGALMDTRCNHGLELITTASFTPGTQK